MQTAMKLDFPADDIVQAARPEERRGADRIITVYRIARISTGSDAGLCRVLNISDSGMMLMSSLAVTPGDPILVSLSETIQVPGKVVWCEGARLGVCFLAPVDAAAILSSLAGARQSGAGRPTRLPTNTVAVAMTPYRTGIVTLRNISQQGMQLSHDGSFTVGLPVKVILRNGLERRGIVRWSNDNVAGLSLLEPISHHELESASKL